MEEKISGSLEFVELAVRSSRSRYRCSNFSSLPHLHTGSTWEALDKLAVGLLLSARKIRIFSFFVLFILSFLLFVGARVEVVVSKAMVDGGYEFGYFPWIDD